MVDPDKPIIEVNNVSFRYDLRNEKNTLSSVSFSVHRGEWVAIVGNNGSGKSTLAGLLIGLLQPSEGSIFIDGIELNEESKWKIRRQMGIVFQNPDNQFIGTTVQDDVAFGLENINMPFSKMQERVDKSLKMVGMYDHRLDDPSRLSGGQKQRVAIAGILALQPDILLLDEAFVMLDPKSRKDLLTTLQQLKMDHHLTILSITHDMNEAAASDRMLVLQDGKMVNSGAPRDVFTNALELEAPFAEKLRRILQHKGRPVPKTYMTEKDLVQWLCK